MKKTTTNTFGERLKVLRTTTSLPQEELAKRLFMLRSWKHRGRFLVLRKI